ncbi:MAG: hypothetical protein ACOCWM_01010 [Cyclobacteriaceae bacterium]
MQKLRGDFMIKVKRLEWAEKDYIVTVLYPDNGENPVRYYIENYSAEDRFNNALQKNDTVLIPENEADLLEDDIFRHYDFDTGGEIYSEKVWCGGVGTLYIWFNFKDIISVSYKKINRCKSCGAIQE